MSKKMLPESTASGSGVLSQALKVRRHWARGWRQVGFVAITPPVQ